MKNPFSKREMLHIEKPDCLATILFCDMKAFTQFVDPLTSAQAIQGLDSYLKIIVSAIEENRGTVSKFIGDALLAYWLEEKHSNHAALACHFTASIQERLSVLPFEIKSLVGIHTGHVTLVRIEHGNYRSLEPISDAVNTASRLNTLCSHYGVRAIASESVILQANGVSGWNNLGPISIKGKAKPLTLYGLT